MYEETVIGVDLGGTNLRVGKVKNSKLVDRVNCPVPSEGSEDVVLNRIYSSIDMLFDKEVKGIGLGVPSVVDVEKGIVYTVENIPSWQKVFLKDKLEARYKVPAFINNDANTFALGECYFGKGKDFRNIIGLTIGTGMGAGVIIDNRLYNGVNCGAGEFGMIPYKEANFEFYCSGALFKRECDSPGKTMYKKAKDGDQKALEIFKVFGDHLGDAIMAVLYAYDPEIIILGGSVSKSFNFFKETMWEKLKSSYGYPHALESLQIVVTESSELPILGAAALYFNAQNKV
ncbi:MAG: ROK family protein [bacterium]|nr:ROK family protein [bacterium]